jgi:dipeptidyl aminopeptidase/acylaminoacyl peptidase
MAVPYWEDKDAHRRNSPIERVHTMTTPLLLAHGNKDRVVEYFQSTVLYNFARRAGKPVILPTFEDEDHSLGRPPRVAGPRSRRGAAARPAAPALTRAAPRRQRGRGGRDGPR